MRLIHRAGVKRPCQEIYLKFCRIIGHINMRKDSIAETLNSIVLFQRSQGENGRFSPAQHAVIPRGQNAWSVNSNNVQILHRDPL